MFPSFFVTPTCTPFHFTNIFILSFAYLFHGFLKSIIPPILFVFHDSAVTASAADLETMNLSMIVLIISTIVFPIDSFIWLTMAGKGIIVADANTNTLDCHYTLLCFWKNNNDNSRNLNFYITFREL